MTNYEKLKQVIQAANPEDDRWNVILKDEEPIRLADVLLAIWQNYPTRIFVSGGGIFSDVDDQELADWNLRNDSLDAQSDETKQFLIRLLLEQQ